MVKVDYEKRIGEIFVSTDTGQHYVIPIYGGPNILFAAVIEFGSGSKKDRQLGMFYVDEDHLCRAWYHCHDVFGYEGHPHVKITKVRLNTWFRVYQILALFLTEQGLPVSLYRKKCTRVSDNMIPLT